jgi:hypothetical protein
MSFSRCRDSRSTSLLPSSPPSNLSLRSFSRLADHSIAAIDTISKIPELISSIQVQICIVYLHKTQLEAEVSRTRERRQPNGKTISISGLKTMAQELVTNAFPLTFRCYRHSGHILGTSVSLKLQPQFSKHLVDSQ